MEYAAEEALAILRRNNVTVLPGLKVLADAGHNKVFSGRREDGMLWRITKIDDDRFMIDLESGLILMEDEPKEE